MTGKFCNQCLLFSSDRRVFFRDVFKNSDFGKLFPLQSVYSYPDTSVLFLHLRVSLRGDHHKSQMFVL